MNQTLKMRRAERQMRDQQWDKWLKHVGPQWQKAGLHRPFFDGSTHTSLSSKKVQNKNDPKAI